jgi:hypothetical protein
MYAVRFGSGQKTGDASEGASCRVGQEQAVGGGLSPAERSLDRGWQPNIKQQLPFAV